MSFKLLVMSGLWFINYQGKLARIIAAKGAK